MNDCESAQKAAKFKADDQTSIFKRQNRTPSFFVFIDWNEDSSIKVNSLEMEGGNQNRKRRKLTCDFYSL